MSENRYQLNLSSSTASLIKGLHPHLKQRIRKALEEISLEPAKGKLLKDELAGLRSYRIGKTRIIYRVGEEKVIEIVAVGSRKSIYVETYRLLLGESD